MFITLEGPEGSGKTSQVQPLADYLRSPGIHRLHHPRAGRNGDRRPGARDPQATATTPNMNPRTETLLFCSARAQLVEEVHPPAAWQGRRSCISDRYADSTLAYQGYGHGNDLSLLRQLLNFATGGSVARPDLAVWILTQNRA